MNKEINYENTNKGNHHCRNLVIRCMDFRFQKYLEPLLEQALVNEGGLGNYDSPGLGGGGSKAIIDTESRKVAYGAIDIAKDLHGVTNIIIVDHIDCGAYGGSGAQENEAAEEAFHRQKLLEAKTIIKENYPGLTVKLFYQTWDSLKQIAGE